MPRRARCSRATRGTAISRSRVAFAGPDGHQTSWTGDRASSSAGSATRRSHSRSSARRTLSGRVGAGLDACAAMQAEVELAPAGARRSAPPRRRPASHDEAVALIAYAVADLDAGRSQRSASAGTACSVPSRSRRRTARWTCCMNRWLPVPDAELSRLGARGVLPGGRRVRLPRPAAGRHGARAGRTPEDVRATPAARGVAPVQAGRRAALVASAAGPRRAHALSDDRLWLPTRSRTTSRDAATRRCSTSRCRSSTARRSRDGEARVLFEPDDRGPDRDSLRALRARASSAARGRARTDCR